MPVVAISGIANSPRKCGAAIERAAYKEAAPNGFEK
jgi:hypothetical protein